MATRFPQMVAAENAQQAGDDLTAIQGIGPAIAERLHSAGIRRYAQLARQTPDGLAALFTDMIGFTVARIQRQDWIGQAQALVPPEADIPDPGLTDNSQTRQHYAVFTVELLLDESMKVRRTRSLHVQTQQERTWSNWDGASLLDFIQESAGLSAQPPRAAHPPVEDVPKPVPAPVADVSETTLAPQTSALSGSFSVKEMQMIVRGESQPPWVVTASQPFNIRLGLDLSQVESPPVQDVRYQATVYAKKIGQADKLVVGRSQGRLALTDSFAIDVRCQVEEKGKYRMEVLVAVLPQADTLRHADQIVALSEGKLLTVN